jgi:SAM-dependent methyltransferase
MRDVRQLKKSLRLVKFRFENRKKDSFTCPACTYKGPFEDVNPPSGLRKHAKCPKCGALERHRIQYLVVNHIMNEINVSRLKMLHFAPEPFFKEMFSTRFGVYETADLKMPGVDHNVDLQSLPFRDGSYDFIFASHVLEHVPNDDKALKEIRRVLSSNGIAVLPVPLLAIQTVEYPEPNPNESYHVRAPGMDYFERYKQHFARVEKFSSDSLPDEYQLYVREDRSLWPSEKCPLRPSMHGEKHIDVVPVCYV